MRFPIVLLLAGCVSKSGPAPAFSLHLPASTLLFSAEVGSCDEQRLVLENDGTATGTVTFQAPVWDCSDPGAFRVGAGSVTLEAGSSAEIAVSYCPSAPGSCGATLPLTWSQEGGGATGTEAVTLLGGGTSPDDDSDGYAVADGDCDDGEATVHPTAPELENQRDDDCDGVVDEGTSLYDDDEDGYTERAGDCDDASVAFNPGVVETPDGRDQDCDGRVDNDTDVFDDDGDGFSEEEGDCADANADRFPGNVEEADGVDENCDGRVDDTTAAYDDDGDGVTENGGDCDDANPEVHPGATELPDGDDQNCNGVVDDNTVALDDDGDGYSELDGDCNDFSITIHPSASEVADGRDDNCNGTVDEGTEVYDDDGDGMTEAGGDCNDGDPSVYVGATETADGVDDDCDLFIDEGTDACDDDGDGFTEEEGDCNDARPDVNPVGAENTADGVDQNCDGDVDEFTPAFGVNEIDSAEMSAMTSGNGFSAAAFGITDLLAEIDWTDVYGRNYVTPVDNQGQCGSCTIYAGSAVAESSLVIQSGAPNTLNLSESYFVDCGRSLVDYCGNKIDPVAQNILALGADLESENVDSAVCHSADTNGDGLADCVEDSSGSCDGSPDYAFDDYYYAAAADETATKAMLHLGPVYATMAAYSDLQSAGTTTAYSPSGTAAFQGYHAVTLVGYNESGWLVKNSWGTSRNTNGFFRLAYNASSILFQGSILLEADGGEVTRGLELLDYNNIAEVANLPNGTVCGLVHDPHGGALCEGYDARTGCPAGYQQRYGGDFGLDVGEGFYWCEVASGTDAADTSALPDGVVCGLKHRLNGPASATCMGYDAEAGSCPSGFTAMYGGDMEAPSAADGFYWCELTSGCEDASCLATGISGIACGLGYDTEDHGRCMNVSPVETGTCPVGASYSRLGDDGRSAESVGYAACSTDG